MLTKWSLSTLTIFFSGEYLVYDSATNLWVRLLFSVHTHKSWMYMYFEYTVQFVFSIAIKIDVYILYISVKYCTYFLHPWGETRHVLWVTHPVSAPSILCRHLIPPLAGPGVRVSPFIYLTCNSNLCFETDFSLVS
jgi:hypothetical protein